LIISILIITNIFFIFKLLINENFSINYQNVLSNIEKGNQYVVEQNLSDGCFPYRYFNHACYYDESKNYLVSSTLQDKNLTHKEVVNLCYKFSHKGSVVYCLSMNQEKQKCMDFAGSNSYLSRICNLKEGELIPSQKYGPYQTDNYNFKVDSWNTIEPIYYSELI